MIMSAQDARGPGEHEAGQEARDPARDYYFGPTQVSMTSHLALRCSATGFLKSWP